MSHLAFLFPGQGAQLVGMGHELAQSLDAAGRLFEQAGDVLGYDLAKLCFEGPEAQLNTTVHSQPAIFVTSLAALESLREQSPDVVDSCQMAAGLSLGEYTAMVFAGVMDFESALRVVQRRGEAMQAASDARASGMISLLGLDFEQVEEICQQVRDEGGLLQVANFLCPKNIVVSGDEDACTKAETLALGAGAMKAIPLAVAGAFHTPIMQPAVDDLTEALEKVELSRPRIPVVSNVDAQPHDDPEAIRSLLIQQVISPVRWEDSMRYMLDQGVDEMYEIGPGKVLKGLMRRIDRKLTVHNAP